MANTITRRELLKSVGYATGASVATLGHPAVLRAAAQPAKMGILVSLTGVHAIFGETMLHCAQYAQKEINDRGGIEGRKLDFVIEDDETDPKVGIEKARKLIKRDQVDVVVGSISSELMSCVRSACASAGVFPSNADQRRWRPPAALKTQKSWTRPAEISAKASRPP